MKKLIAALLALLLALPAFAEKTAKTVDGWLYDAMMHSFALLTDEGALLYFSQDEADVTGLKDGLILGQRLTVEYDGNRALSIRDGAISPEIGFAFSLFSELAKAQEGNLIVSPLSAYAALSMLLPGARGETKAALSALLGTESPEKALAALLALPGISGANTVFADESISLKESYAEFLRERYGADVQIADLDTDVAREAVNSWVSEATKGRIPELLSENLPDNAVIALINALCFEAKWQTPFGAESTREGEFTRANGQTVPVDYMNQSEKLTYLRDGACEGVVLPCESSTLALAALMPLGEETVYTLAQGMNATDFHSLLICGSSKNVALTLPKFDVKTSRTLDDALRALGLGIAYDANLADLGDMAETNGGNLSISTVLQSASLRVDEDGAEAAASTMVLIKNCSLPLGDRVTLRFDRPFLAIVYDTLTHAPVFMAIIENPAK